MAFIKVWWNLYKLLMPVATDYSPLTVSISDLQISPFFLGVLPNERVMFDYQKVMQKVVVALRKFGACTEFISGRMIKTLEV